VSTDEGRTEQKASLYRAQGEEAYSPSSATPTKRVQVLIAEANQQAQRLRGENDATRNRLPRPMARPEFFAFTAPCWRMSAPSERDAAGDLAGFGILPLLRKQGRPVS
jgi:hypothetical protein